MPHFTLQVDAAGPIVNLTVHVSEARRAALEAEGRPIPPPRVLRGLVDTGASFTSIEPAVLQALELAPTGTIDIVTPSTGAAVHTTNTYDVDIVIYAAQGDPPLSISNLEVGACELYLQQGIHALIGRDILRKCVLIYNGGQKTFTLAF